MNYIYKIPGYMLLLFGGFCLSWGGLIVRSFGSTDAWVILLLRSSFFFLGVSVFLLSIYKKDAFKTIKKAGLAGLLGGFVMSFSFIAFVFAMMNTSVANVVLLLALKQCFSNFWLFLFKKKKFQ